MFAMCLIFPLLCRLNRRTRGWATWLIALGSMVLCQMLTAAGAAIMESGYEKMLTRISVFMAGVALSDHLYHTGRVEWKKFAALVASLTAVCLISCKASGSGLPGAWRYLYGIAGLVIAMAYAAVRVKLLPVLRLRWLDWLGAFSYEIYLAHILFITILDHYRVWDALPWFVWYALIPAAGITLGWAAHTCAAKLCRRMR